MTPDLKSLTVLVIEDEAFMRRLIARMLRDVGVGEVLEESDGAAGLKTLLEKKSQIDLLFLDLMMPKLDGFGVLKFIRNAEEVNEKALPVVVLTGHAEADKVKEAATLGINGYLVKPVSKKALVEATVRALKRAPTHG
ncbi:chemotaxis response regulator CheY [Magnetospira thiophila]